MSKLITTISSKIDVPKIRVHDLRHCHATFLIRNKVNIKVVTSRMRHKDIQTTLNTYAHVWDTADKEVTDMINEMCPKRAQN
ncbi:tyrosine-type recombinase/integrase [Globicatella sulfidifaciens]